MQSTPSDDSKKMPPCGDPVCAGRCLQCIGLDGFWDGIENQLELCEAAKSYREVHDIIGDTFYGSGGDEQLDNSLWKAGWRYAPLLDGWRHHWRMKAPNGDVMEYCEGDISLVSTGKETT